jgi:hypothetical protein
MRKITIEPTTGADTRSATEVVAKDVLLRESHLHRSHVRRLMAVVAAELIERAERHDDTKISGIDGFHDAFARTMRKEVQFKDHPWWTLHLTEKHHINDRLHEDADLLDLVEMVVDCACAGMARTGRVFPIEVSSEILQRLLRNTASKLIAAIEVSAPPPGAPATPGDEGGGA